MLVILFLLIASIAYPVGELIKWTLPTTNEDGTALTDLAGTHVYCDGTNVADVKAPTNTYMMLVDCKEIHVTAYDTSSNESVKSNSIDTLKPSGCTDLRRN